MRYLQKIWQNRVVRNILIVSLVGLSIYIVLRLFIFENDPILPFLNTCYHIYLLLPEWIANGLFRLFNAGVSISDHQLLFETRSAYHDEYNEFLVNWDKVLLIKRYSILLLAIIWFNYSTLRKKFVFSFLLVLFHAVSIVGGLFLLGVILPGKITEHTTYYVSPTLVGTGIMYIFLVIWVICNKNEIRMTLRKLGLSINLSDKRIFEILISLFFLLLLRDYLLPFIAYENYVIFLLEITRQVAVIFNHDGYIIGDQLVGQYGALALSKHCLGFMMMYLYAAMIFLTRPNGGIKTTGIYIISGLLILSFLNVIRLVLVFLVAQGENGFQKASLHHEIYNVAIYIFVFIMWAIWFELLRKRS